MTSIKENGRLPRCSINLISRCICVLCTGEEVDFIELLQSFGVSIPSLSTELGIDMESLVHMDQEELLNLLTQQSN